MTQLQRVLVRLLERTYRWMPAAYASLAWLELLANYPSFLQDKHDDVKAGIRSTALTFGARTKAYCAGFGAASVALLAATGQAAGCGPAYYAGGLGRDARGWDERMGGAAGAAWRLQAVRGHAATLLAPMWPCC